MAWYPGRSRSIRRCAVMKHPATLTTEEESEQRRADPVTDSVNPNQFYDDATDVFPKVEHLAPSLPPNFGPGRLLAIWATGEGTRMNKEGKIYPYVETITVTLDDGPSGLDGPGWEAMAAEIIPEGVQRLDKFQHSTGGLVARLQRRLTGRNQDGVPLRYRPMIGRLDTQPSKQNKNVAAYSIKPPTDDDRAVIEQHVEMIAAINEELRMAAIASSDPDQAAFND